MTFFSKKELSGFDGVTKKPPPWLDAAGAAASGKQATRLTAVDRARAKIQAMNNSTVTEATTEGRGAGPAKVRPTSPATSPATSSFTFFSADSFMAAQINHHGQKETECTETHNKVIKVSVKRKALDGGAGHHPFRREAPVKLAYTRGSEESLDVVCLDDQVVQDIRADELAKTTVPTVNARWAWWTRRCRARGWDPEELTPRKLEIAAGLLEKGGIGPGRHTPPR